MGWTMFLVICQVEQKSTPRRMDLAFCDHPDAAGGGGDGSASAGSAAINWISPSRTKQVLKKIRCASSKPNPSTLWFPYSRYHNDRPLQLSFVWLYRRIWELPRACWRQANNLMYQTFWTIFPVDRTLTPVICRAYWQVCFFLLRSAYRYDNGCNSEKKHS